MKFVRNQVSLKSCVVQVLQRHLKTSRKCVAIMFMSRSDSFKQFVMNNHCNSNMDSNFWPTIGISVVLPASSNSRNFQKLFCSIFVLLTDEYNECSVNNFSILSEKHENDCEKQTSFPARAQELKLYSKIRMGIQSSFTHTKWSD